VPGLNTDASYPSWSSDGELLAYSASSTVKSDQTNTLNRDIYYYDIIAKMTEKVSTSPQDDFDPAWSPGELKMLVFCRSDGNYSQLWLASFDAYGKPSERQLTKYGGLNPAWSPDGDKIIYENNAQLWTVNLDGTNENPILLNDEPVFGLDPFWTR
jgi:Tol biopolymer transport system component